MITKDDELKIGFTSNPMPWNQLFGTLSNVGIASNYEVQLGILGFIIHVTIISKIAKNFESGFYTSAQMKGSTRMTYLLGTYLVDVFHYLLFIPVNQFILFCFNIVMPGFWVTSLLWAFADPLFLYFLCYFLIQARGFKGSTVLSLVSLIDILCIIVDEQGAVGLTSPSPQ